MAKSRRSRRQAAPAERVESVDTTDSHLRPRSGPDHAAVGYRDPARERRVKALSCTQPLHDLQTNRGRRGWDAFDFYDLGLAAIDAVVDRMGFDSGMRREDLEAALFGEARRFAPDLSAGRLQRVVEALVETLIRPNAVEYLSTANDVKRRFDFALLTEHEDPEGGYYLRATHEAINVLVGGLNTDVESAQVAAEATLEHLIRRGRLDAAGRPAREAKVRSVQFAQQVKKIIDETRRDIRRAGWRDDVPKRLEEIREHLDERMKTEGRLLSAMQEARDSASREDLRRQAAVLVENVDDCFTRHQELHTITLQAIKVFVEEQDRQVFGRAAIVGAVDITDELLLPVLGLPIAHAEPLVFQFAERMLGFGPGPRSESVVPRLQPRLGTFLLQLLRPPQPRDAFGDPVEEVEWEEPVVDPQAFTAEAWTAADGVIDALEVPERLDMLLARTEEAHGFDVADLLRLRAMAATAPDLDSVRPGAAPVLAAAADGAAFESASFRGANLLCGLLTPVAPQKAAPGQEAGPADQPAVVAGAP